jgi:hypothetical protein
VIVKQIKNDKGKIPFFENYIYMNCVTSFMKILTRHGLYLVPKRVMDDVAPTFAPTVKYITERDLTAKDDFEILHKDLFKKKDKFSIRTTRCMPLSSFNILNTDTMSILPFFVLSYISHLHDNAFRTLNQFPIFKKGNYKGTPVVSPNTPNNNMYLDGKDGVGHLINKITDCTFKCNDEAKNYSIEVVAWMMFKDKKEHLSGNVPEKWKLYARNWFDDDEKEPFITISTEDAEAKSPPTTKKSCKRRECE